MTNQPIARGSRIPSLDGMRAISIIMVLIGHAAYAKRSGSWITDAYARAGVLVFFVISGYLITTLILREMRKTGTFSMSGFYTRRAWRILPVAFLYLAVITFLQHRDYSFRDLVLAWTYCESYATLFGRTQWNLAHLWSLSVEEQFYVLWPLILFFSRKWARRVCWACLVIAPICRYVLDSHNMLIPLSVVDSIAVGCLCALYAPKIGRIGNFSWVAIALLPMLANIQNTHRIRFIPQLLGHGMWTIFNIAVAVALLAAIDSAPRLLNNRPFVTLGVLSYSLYIWHMPLMNSELHIDMIWRLTISFVLAVSSYYLIERPALWYRKGPRSSMVELSTLNRQTGVRFPAGVPKSFFGEQHER